MYSGYVLICIKVMYSGYVAYLANRFATRKFMHRAGVQGFPGTQNVGNPESTIVTIYTGNRPRVRCTDVVFFFNFKIRSFQHQGACDKSRCLVVRVPSTGLLPHI